MNATQATAIGDVAARIIERYLHEKVLMEVTKRLNAVVEAMGDVTVTIHRDAGSEGGITVTFGVRP